MLRRTILQMLTSMPFLRGLVAGGTPVTWRFEPLVSMPYMYGMLTTMNVGEWRVIPGMGGREYPDTTRTSMPSIANEAQGYMDVMIRWVRRQGYKVTPLPASLDVRVEADYESLSRFMAVFCIAMYHEATHDASVASCELVVHGTEKDIGLLAIRNAEAHKEAFMVACNQCAVPPEAYACVIEAFDRVERCKAM